MLSIYLRLLACCLVPISLSAVFYLLRHKTRFRGLPYITQQVIIGVAFGLCAIYATEFGVEIQDVTVNVRDAAPLCAGLIFGGPAGIIAGVIGGVERWFASYWGAGAYTQVACSVSTVLAGLYAAVLRRFMFDNKRPTWGIGIGCGAVMEVIHLTLVYLTHANDPSTAYEVIKTCTFPMILANSVAIAVSIMVIAILKTRINPQKKLRGRHIAQRVQRWLLLCVFAGYILTTGCVYFLQTQTAYNNFNTRARLNITDVESDIKNAADDSLLSLARRAARVINIDPDVDPTVVAEAMDVKEVSYIGADGIIYNSSDPRFIGFDMHSGEQSSEFLCLLDGTCTEYVQPLENITYAIENGTEEMRKYAGVTLKNGGFVQIGVDSDGVQSRIAEKISTLARNRRIGDSGYIVIADDDFTIVSSRMGNVGDQLSFIGLDLNAGSIPSGRFKATVYGETCYCYCRSIENYYIIAVQPIFEVMLNRNSAAYVNSFMEVLIFAALFTLIYFLIKILVVNNISTINRSLGKIIEGDLNVTVDVRGSDEFASLSDDINTTVDTLKHYIDEAAARIDQELEFARSIQHAALPSVFPAFPGLTQFDVYAIMDAAKEVGGDFYDFYMVGSGKLGFLVADVSGKSIPGAMFMMRAKTMIKDLASSGMPVNEVLTQANAGLCEGNDAEMFVTAWMGVLDLETGHVCFANAGHNPPLLFRNGEGYSYLRTRPGFVLGGMEGMKYKMGEFDMMPGERLLLYTDGITEATNIHKELYGETRLQTWLNEHTDLSIQDTLTGVKADADAFTGEADQFDDMTLLIVEYRGNDPQK